MMLPTPRVIAIDDDPKHLTGLTEGLNRCGTACSPIRFTGDLESMQIQPCPHVRVIFADLNLFPAQSSRSNFATIAALIEKIKPSGPYFIVLWTISPDKADDLYDFLQRLDKKMRPLIVRALDKNPYLDLATGSAKNPEALAEAIQEMIAGQRQVAALFDWETRISDAAADTVSSILKLVEVAAADRAEEISRLLASLAVGAVGKEHVEKDRFRAVNEALLPILADRIAFMRSEERDKELWGAAFKESDARRELSLAEAAKLNRLLHIALPTADSTGVERGAVIDLPISGDEFEQAFGIEQNEAAQKQFRCPQFDDRDARFRWVLVQSQAICDYAQPKPGPLPFHLGLLMPSSEVGADKPPAALWDSPYFEFREEICILHVNARFQMALLPNAEVVKRQPLFRLREQLLSDLIYRIHSYGARPGIIKFPEPKKSKKKQRTAAHNASKQHPGGDGSAGHHQ